MNPTPIIMELIVLQLERQMRRREHQIMCTILLLQKAMIQRSSHLACVERHHKVVNPNRGNSERP